MFNKQSLTMADIYLKVMLPDHIFLFATVHLYEDRIKLDPDAIVKVHADGRIECDDPRFLEIFTKRDVDRVTLSGAPSPNGITAKLYAGDVVSLIYTPYPDRLLNALITSERLLETSRSVIVGIIRLLEER